MQADREVPQCGQDLRPAAGVDPGGVLAEGDVTDPVQAVLDLPVPAQPCRELVGVSPVGVEVGDRVDGFDAPAPLAAGAGVDRSAAADQPDGLAGVRNTIPAAMVTTFSMRISRRPWALSTVLCPTSTSRQGSSAS